MDDDGTSSGVKRIAPLDVSVFISASIVVATEWGGTPSGGESSTRLARRDQTNASRLLFLEEIAPRTTKGEKGPADLLVRSARATCSRRPAARLGGGPAARTGSRPPERS